MLEHCGRQLQQLAATMPVLERQAPAQAELDDIVARGYLRPHEDEALLRWFADFLCRRELLCSLIEQARERLPRLARIEHIDEWRWLLVGFAGACLLVGQDRFFLWRVATHTLIQRKLNEGCTERAIERKAYSRIFARYTDPVAALRLYQVMRFLRRNQARLKAMEQDHLVGPYVTELSHLQRYLNPSKRVFLRRLSSYIRHRWRRRGASAKQKIQFGLLALGGRLVSYFNWKRGKWVSAAVREEIGRVLRPGDILVTRHRRALTNWLLPGTWPHAALYIGTEAQRKAEGIAVSEALAQRWHGHKCTLEALRDGVLFRTLEQTLSVDQFVVLRPLMSSAAIAGALERVARHEGKAYNFDFDFFRADRLVCTEVIYRAYDGIDGLRFPLVMRSHRPTLTAEDLLDMALAGRWFKPLAIFGFPKGRRDIILGDPVFDVLAKSYQRSD